MKILVVGSGGREHAISWKVSQSPRLSKLYIAPGNAGTSQLGENVQIGAEDVSKLTEFAQSKQIDLVLVGPESALAAGLVDTMAQAGVRAFGPTKSAAEIESSKVYSKWFMERHGIPTARFSTFSDYQNALTFLNQTNFPIVIKTSGLAAGKGVLLPSNVEEAQNALKTVMVERSFGEAGDEVVIEERLEGEEVSLLAFSDGYTVFPMLPVQDHKRLLAQDQGPNTGGMGAYAPAPVCPPELVEQICQQILQPTIDGLRNEGRIYCGVLYAGLILTKTGVQVLEYNCRFGDPETQVLLPLLENDLIDIAEACIERRLNKVPVVWKPDAAATVVLASGGYPNKYPTGIPIHGLAAAQKNAIIFHAGTQWAGSQVVTAGGRVLNVTGCSANLELALNQAYQAIGEINFTGMQYRSDIGHRALRRNIIRHGSPSAYAESGVDIDAGNRAVTLMRQAVLSTYSPEVLSGIGTFGGMYNANQIKIMRDPVLVASTDGVGTKVRLAAAIGRFESIGHDIVNHCINDILVQGAHPIFFLDYIASSKLDPVMVAQVVNGISAACREAGCALLGGETAEMPGVYGPGEFDLAGTIVGLVERELILPRINQIHSGDLLVGLASSGPHTNGYSLIRKVFLDVPLDTVFPELGIPLCDALLEPHRSYLPIVLPAVNLLQGRLKALAHLTGGGFIENIPRVLPDNLHARIQRGSWPVPPLFGKIQTAGNVTEDEMYRVFNMGIGMVAIIAPEHLEDFQQVVSEQTWVIGKIVDGERGVTLWEDR